jgi:hypothetical protein
MHENRTLATPEVATLNEADRLNFALAAIVVQAQKLPKGSAARSALVAAAAPIRNTLDAITAPH